MQALILALAIALLATATWQDLRARRIPNALPLAIAGLALLRLIAAGDRAPALWSIAAAIAVFAMALLLWRRGLLGGGDAKLMAAAALLIGHHDLLRFLVLMSLVGGALALAVLGADRFGRPAALPQPALGGIEAPARPSVPYGVAIAAAAVLVLIQQYALTR